MTIQRRLFWSNIVMLVLPVTLSIVLSYLILFVFTKGSPVDMERAFPRAFNIIFRYQQSQDFDQLMESVDNFNAEFGEDSVYMLVAPDRGPVYPEEVVQKLSDRHSLFDMILSKDVTGSISVNNVRYAIEQAGPYRIILVDQQFRLSRIPVRPRIIHQVLLLIVITVAMIFITNQSLTRLITKRIVASLDCLADGVHQLRDGNLDYRIHYKDADEFSPVVDDFNEMAVQLQRLILLQQRDEISRKELLAGLSHDLRTPLTSIKAYVEGLLDGVADDYAAQLKYLGIIRNKAEDIDKIVDKLFLFSKLEIGEYPFYHEQLNLGLELQAMVDAAQEEYGEKGMQVLLEEIPEDTRIYADPVQLHNALTNILENSWKYKQKEQCTVRVSCRDGERFVVLRLTDDGPGVPEENLEKLFDVFYRSDPSRQNPSKGSGLGLAITAKILTRMGGMIRAENTPGGGLCLVLQLPKYAQEEQWQ